MLGRVGVPDDLRPRIHRAIDTGAVWLARHLDKDDQFRFAGPDRPAADDGSSALVTLALAHAGTPTVLPAARRSAQRLFGLASDGRRVRDGQPTRATYDTGLLGLLSADAGLAVPRTCARELAAAFERGQDARSGGWGYQLTTGGGTVSRLRPGAKAPVPVRNPVNLSTTQFAALGAHAAGLAGAPVDLDVWRRHAEGLCAAQAQDGS